MSAPDGTKRVSGQHSAGEKETPTGTSGTGKGVHEKSMASQEKSAPSQQKGTSAASHDKSPPAHAKKSASSSSSSSSSSSHEKHENTVASQLAARDDEDKWVEGSGAVKDRSNAWGMRSDGKVDQVVLDHRDVVAKSLKDRLPSHSDPIPGIEKAPEKDQRESNTPMYMGAAFFTVLGAFAALNMRKGKGASRGTMEARVAAQGIALASIGGLGVYYAMRPQHHGTASPLSSLPAYYQPKRIRGPFRPRREEDE